MKKLLFTLTAAAMSLSSLALPTLPATTVDDLVGVYTWNYATYTENFSAQPDTLASYTNYTKNGIVINKVNDNTVRITGMFAYPITATVDFSASTPRFTLSKTDEIYYHSGNGNKYTLNARYYSTNNSAWYTANVFGYFMNGYIQLAPDAHFYYYNAAGNTLLNPKWAPGGRLTPNTSYNGIMTYDYTVSTSGIAATYDYAVNINEDANCVVTVNGFGGLSNVAPVTIELAADRTFNIPADQTLYSSGDQDYVLRGYITATSTIINEITGTGDETKLTFDISWTGRSASYWLGNRSNTSITLLDGEFEYPVAVPTELTLNYTDDNEVMLNPEQTLQLEVVEVVPEYASKEVTWISSDNNVATVDANGLVTAVGNTPQAVIVGGRRAPIAPDGKQLLPVTITATSAVATPGAAPASASVKLYVVVDDSTVGVTDINPDQAKSVKYVNAQGMVSDQPFDGMNIQVITLTDGTVKTVKVVK